VSLRLWRGERGAFANGLIYEERVNIRQYEFLSARGRPTNSARGSDGLDAGRAGIQRDLVSKATS